MKKIKKNLTQFIYQKAASNVTGIILDIDKISCLLHKYGFLSFWVYSTAAPHLTIDMNPSSNDLAYKDAIFFSGHKFLGGKQKKFYSEK